MVVGAVILTFFVGEDYFPQISAGQMRLHVRGPTGLRVEETERLFQAVEDEIRRVVPARDLDLILDNIGMPAINYNLSYDDGSTVAMNDGQILINLNEGHGSTEEYMRRLRAVLREKFPSATFYFQPADIITQILNFGLPAPIDIQVVGNDADNNRRVALDLLPRVKGVRGAVDVHLHQIVEFPELFRQRRSGARVADRLDRAADRQRSQHVAELQLPGVAEFLGRSQNRRSVSGGRADARVPPEQHERPREHAADALRPGRHEARNAFERGDAVARADADADNPQQHSKNLRRLRKRAGPRSRLDRGRPQADPARIPERLKPGNQIVLRGQMKSKNDAFLHLGLGLIGALVFVYLLMVLNFQNWGDPFVVLAALPLAFCGIVGSLFITQTTLSIPSLMGAIMSIGVASANSILLVTFAREHREATGCSAVEAAIMAGRTRLRPVLMTAGAMFVGMLPMSLGLAEGSEANAALARAVLGGIAVGTCSTLLFVPFLYAVLRRGEVRPLEDYV